VYYREFVGEVSKLVAVMGYTPEVIQEVEKMLKPKIDRQIPEETIKIAKAAFPNGNIYLTLRDALGPIYEDQTFQGLYPTLRQPAESPGRLALVTLMQYLENLSDRQAADAVRSRIDWKYMLGLKLDDPGFDFSVLSEFRQRLIEGKAETVLLDKLLERCEALGLLKGKKKQRTDSTHVIAVVRSLTLLELVGETLRRVLDEAAQLAPDWLRAHLKPEWVQRYARRFDGYRLPSGKAKREALAVRIGEDGFYLLQAIYSDTGPQALKESSKVETLRRIWVQQFYVEDGKVYWRTKDTLGQPPAGKMIGSPDDLDAKYCVKRSTEWHGYKVHFTETCQTEYPRLITQVETTLSTVHDSKVTSKIQDELAAKGRLPEIQLVDEGYMEIDLLLASQNRGMDLVGPVPSSKCWQDRVEGALDHTQFHIDWEKRVATCPNQKTSVRCTDRKTWRGTPNIYFVFNKEDCLPCPMRVRCSHAKNAGRTLTIYPKEQYEAQLAARQRQQTEVFKKLYGERAGIESTMSQGVRRIHLRYARYIGLARTHLQEIASAGAINLARLFSWLIGERPKATRISPFLALATQT
jgi:transposase